MSTYIAIDNRRTTIKASMKLKTFVFEPFLSIVFAWDIKALLNFPQPHFDGVGFLKEIVRQRESKQKNCTTYMTCVHHKSISRAINIIAPLSFNGWLSQMRERLKSTLDLIGNYHSICT
jgi:hypothetical protein